MASRPFRFVHAADFHLERPVRGLTEVPEHLREVFRDAPYLAAAKVFDIAIADDVDFLVLTGDLLHPGTSGLRGLLFLSEQFQRLADSGITVYWCGGRDDRPDAWPRGFALPDNVYVFPSGRPTTLVHSRDDEPLVQLVGVSRNSGDVLRPSDLANRHEDVFTLACVHGRVETEQLTKHLIDYWALGGVHQRTQLLDDPYLAQYPGSPQGRSPEEPGAHGCWQVVMDEQGEVHSRFMATDVLRFVRQRIELDEANEAGSLGEQIRTACTELAAADVHLIVEFLVPAEADVCRELRGGPTDELIEQLNVEFGCQQPALWTHRIETQPRESADDVPSATGLLGDFLSLAAACRSGEQTEFPSEDLTALSEQLSAVGDVQQEDIWRDVADLGYELLSNKPQK